MFEFLVTQRWLAHDPDRNWKLWMEQDHAARDLWRERLGQYAPALRQAAAASLTPEQHKEGEAVTAARSRIADELGDRQPDDRKKLEQKAAQVGLSFVYDMLYRYESSVATHPTLFAVDVLLEKHPKGLVLRGEPTAQFAPLPVYLLGVQLLYEALNESSKHTEALRFPELDSLGHDLCALVEQRANERLPNWQELLPSEALHQD